jgi:hypothetical protein
MNHLQEMSSVKYPPRRWRHTATICFSCIKRRWTITGLPFYLKMSGRRRLPRQQAGRGEKAPIFDTCNFLVQNISPAFYPSRFLLRRVFIICEDKSRYVSVGFYPNQNYQPLEESVGAKIKPLTITDNMWRRWQIYSALGKRCVPVNNIPAKTVCSD